MLSTLRYTAKYLDNLNFILHAYLADPKDLRCREPYRKVQPQTHFVNTSVHVHQQNVNSMYRSYICECGNSILNTQPTIKNSHE